MNEIDNFRLKVKMNSLTDSERDTYIKMIEKNIDVRDKNLGFLMSWRKSVGRRYVLALVCSLWLFFYAIFHTDMHWYIIAAMIVSIFFVIIYCIRLCFINWDMKSNQSLVVLCDLDGYQEELKRREMLREELVKKEQMKAEIQIIGTEFQERLNDNLQLVICGEKLSHVLAEYGFHKWVYKQYLDKLTSNIRQSIVGVQRILQKEMQQCVNVDTFRKTLDDVCHKYRLEYKCKTLDEWLLSFDDWFTKYQNNFTDVKKAKYYLLLKKRLVNHEEIFPVEREWYRRYRSDILNRAKILMEEERLLFEKELSETNQKREAYRNWNIFCYIPNYTVQEFFDTCYIYPCKFSDLAGCYVLYNKTKRMYYVGQSKDIICRVKQHFTGKGNGDVYADYKYGDLFEVGLLLLSDTRYKGLNDLERDLIDVFGAYERGYNKTRGNK